MIPTRKFYEMMCDGGGTDWYKEYLRMHKAFLDEMSTADDLKRASGEKDKLIKEIEKSNHLLYASMITAEQRGMDKAKEELGEKDKRIAALEAEVNHWKELAKMHS